MSDEKLEWSAVELEMLTFLQFLRERGFKGCPVCGEPENFTWAHAAQLPDGSVVRMDASLPGTTTIPGKPAEHREPFPTPLIVLICDRCTHVLTFSQAHYAMQRMRHERQGH